MPLAGMVTAAEVEQALKQRLEAKDVVRAFLRRFDQRPCFYQV